MTTTPPSISPTQERQRTKPAWKPRLAWIARWLHTYLSMFSFLVLFFFAATGYTLNHAQWFDSQQRVVQRQGTLDASWVKPGDAGAIKKFEIAQYFRRAEGVKGEPGDFEIDDAQCAVSFKGPGYEADAVVERATGNFTITETRSGFVAVMNDLHKGRDTGAKWSAVIDVTAIGMTLVSLTGLTLIFFLNKRRLYGLIFIAIGGAICYAAYVLWVP